jgi:hypothetical protein
MMVEYANSVTIGPEFFGKSFNDYRDKFWAFVREILQNSIDCGSTAIDITIAEDAGDDSTVVIVRNDGEAMTEEILVGKLLSLGSSGKDFQGAVGGFGKAKEILYFAHKFYTIASGYCRLNGSGAGYNLEDGPFLHGTRSAVTWDGLVADALREQFRRFIALCDRREVGFTLDGELVKPEIPRFRYLRSLEHEGSEWAHLSIHGFEENLFVVRIAGIPMFVERTDFKRTIVLELQGNSGERLTANRDSLRYPYSTRFRDLITQMTVDRRSALKVEKPVYTRYGGPKLKVPSNDAAKKSIDDIAVECVTAARTTPDAGGGIMVLPQGRVEASTSLLSFAFINKNCVNRKIPREFDPLDLKFSDHAQWVAKAWSGCMLELHALLNVDHEFTVGFVFSDDAEAEYEKSAAYGRVYYLNPCVIGKKSIRHRYKKTDRGQIAAVAAHEFVHGGLDCPYHGEDYANWLTEVMGKVLNHWRRFARHFK